MGNQRETFIDTFGLKDDYATFVHFEDAGFGNVRQINCIERAGVLIPVCCIVRPAMSVVNAAPKLVAFCHGLLTGQVATH